MLQESLDLRAEADELYSFLQTLGQEDWRKPTTFMRWTPWDVVAHLHYFDWISIMSLQGEDTFAPKRDELIGLLGAGKTNVEIAREEFAGLNPAELLDRWQSMNRDMCARLGESDPKRRLPWFGPDMGVRMFTTARYMEHWAHGQEVYDLMGVARTHTDRIKGIAVIGVKTFAWTFVNRGLEVPAAPPYVHLTAPSGATWQWNDANDREFISGDAVDFCRTVTQVRNVADTSLEVVGEVANRWMSIAQCFAGGPVDPPVAGTRG